MGPRWRLIGSRELISKETFQQHEVKMSYNLPLDFQWNMKVQISVYLHKKNQVKYFVFFWHSCSVSQSCPTLRDAMDCSTPGFLVLHHLPVCSQSCPLSQWWVHLILCRPLLCLPSIFPSIEVFSNRFALCIRWPKYGSFSISPFNEYSGLNISFRINWFNLLAVQEILKSLL